MHTYLLKPLMQEGWPHFPVNFGVLCNILQNNMSPQIVMEVNYIV